MLVANIVPSSPIFVNSPAHLQLYLHQLGDTGGSSLLPPAVIRVVNSKACRSAIMFGDPLLPTECSELIRQLKLTQLCFSCAHGRPTLAPMVDIAAFERHLVKVRCMKALSNVSLLPVNRTVSLRQRLALLTSKSG